MTTGNDKIDPQALMWARMAGSLTSTQRLVLLELAFHVEIGGDGVVQPVKQQDIAANTSLARGTVSRTINELEALGLIRSSLLRDQEGHWKQYQLEGFFNGWNPGQEL